MRTFRKLEDFKLSAVVADDCSNSKEFRESDLFKVYEQKTEEQWLNLGDPPMTYAQRPQKKGSA